MKGDLFIRISLIIIVVLLALNLILPILSIPAPSYAAKNIEYKVIRTEDLPYDPNKANYFAEETEKLFNEYGKEGWEYIGDITYHYWPGLVIFKR